MVKGFEIKKAFTLVEVVIVVTVIGILAAIAIPVFNGHVAAAKESAVKDNLRIFRTAIDLYTVQHKSVPPGYYGNDIDEEPKLGAFMDQLLTATNDGETTFGPYLNDIPENSFNKGTFVLFSAGFSDEEIPPLSGITVVGWIYSPYTKEIRVNRGGVDSKGVAFSTY